MSFSETYTSIDIRDDSHQIVWRNVRNKRKINHPKLIQEKQDEETKRLDNLRKYDMKGYLELVHEICGIKQSNSIVAQKMRCYIPKDYFEKRAAYNTNEKDEDRRTSLDVHVPHKYDDFISKQAKYRRSLAFKKYLANQESENFLTIPFIEEDAADLADLINMATDKPTFAQKLQYTQTPESIKLPYLTELEEKPKAGLLVSCYVKDYILKLPLLIPDADRIRELYTSCIIKDDHLNKLYKTRRDMLPKDLLDYIADFGASNEADNNPKVIKDEIADRDQFFHTSINVYARDILREIEIDSLEFSVFIKPCYILHFSQVMPDFQLLNLTDQVKIEAFVTKVIEDMKSEIINPISTARKQFMGALMVANTNNTVSQVFIDLLPYWVEVLTKGLFSPHSPIREESCYCIGFLFSQTKLVHELLNFHNSEFVYDITSTIFKAIEHYSSSFEFFYSLIGYIMDGCPLITILQCICDKGPISKNYLMRKRWPKFIVFACKHWPSESFKNGQFSLKKIQDLLERSFLQVITHKTSQMALAYIGRRFERKSLVCTHWIINKVGPTDES